MSRYLICGIMMIMMDIAIAEPRLLVSIEEMNLANSEPQPEFTMKAIPERGVPIIRVATPNLSVPVVTPTPIEIGFQSESPSTIKPETFKVFYGFGPFQKEITDRIISGSAQISSGGIRAKDVALPSGRHKLIVQVEDSEGRVGSQQFEFEVR